MIPNKSSHVGILLRPRILSMRNIGFSTDANGGLIKFLILGILGAIFWGVIFGVSYKVLIYFQTIEDIGDIISFKLLSMLLLIAFSLLVFSSILTILSKLYLSRDLKLVHSLPVKSHQIFIARWIDSTFESSWMVIVYTLPILIAYGVVFGAGSLFYITMLASLFPLSMIASLSSALLVMLSILIIPANRMKTIIIFIGICLFVVLYIAFRLLKPELLVDPEVFLDALMYLKNIETPQSVLLPSTWIYDALKGSLQGDTEKTLLNLLIAVFGTLSLYGLVVAIADKVYFAGVSKSQSAQTRVFSTSISDKTVFDFLPRPVKAMVIKEIRGFMRDHTQWTQLFLIAALVVIYVYNFKVLPLERSPIKTIYLQNLLAFLNMGLALFVLTAVTARFAYPAVSTEKDAFWIIKTSPLPIRYFLWIKFFIYFVPLLVLTEILIVATNILLSVTPFMMVLSSMTVFFLVPAIVSLGIGLGAAYPDFHAENPIQTVTSYGGLVFMILCAGLIGTVILLEAGPVYSIFMSRIYEKPLSLFTWTWVTGAFTISLFLSVFCVFYPMRFGETRLMARFK